MSGERGLPRSGGNPVSASATIAQTIRSQNDRFLFKSVSLLTRGYSTTCHRSVRSSQYFETFASPPSFSPLCRPVPRSSPCSLFPRGLSVPDLLAPWSLGRSGTRLEGRKRQKRQDLCPSASHGTSGPRPLLPDGSGSCQAGTCGPTSCLKSPGDTTSSRSPSGPGG